MPRPYKIKISPKALSAELKKRKMTPQVLAAFAGYSDRSSVYQMIQAGAVTEKLAAALDSLDIPY